MEQGALSKHHPADITRQKSLLTLSDCWRHLTYGVPLASGPATSP
ncbi:MAG: hypothetical protein ACRDBI_14985 [Shewanella sp.]